MSDNFSRVWIVSVGLSDKASKDWPSNHTNASTFDTVAAHCNCLSPGTDIISILPYYWCDLVRAVDDILSCSNSNDISMAEKQRRLEGLICRPYQDFRRYEGYPAVAKANFGETLTQLAKRFHRLVSQDVVRVQTDKVYNKCGLALILNGETDKGLRIRHKLYKFHSLFQWKEGTSCESSYNVDFNNKDEVAAVTSYIRRTLPEATRFVRLSFWADVDNDCLQAYSGIWTRCGNTSDKHASFDAVVVPIFTSISCKGPQIVDDQRFLYTLLRYELDCLDEDRIVLLVPSQILVNRSLKSLKEMSDFFTGQTFSGKLFKNKCKVVVKSYQDPGIKAISMIVIEIHKIVASEDMTTDTPMQTDAESNSKAVVLTRNEASMTRICPEIGSSYLMQGQRLTSDAEDALRRPWDSIEPIETVVETYEGEELDSHSINSEAAEGSSESSLFEDEMCTTLDSAGDEEDMCLDPQGRSDAAVNPIAAFASRNSATSKLPVCPRNGFSHSMQRQSSTKNASTPAPQQSSLANTTALEVEDREESNSPCSSSGNAKSFLEERRYSLLESSSDEDNTLSDTQKQSGASSPLQGQAQQTSWSPGCENHLMSLVKRAVESWKDTAQSKQTEGKQTYLNDPNLFEVRDYITTNTKVLNTKQSGSTVTPLYSALLYSVAVGGLASRVTVRTLLYYASGQSLDCFYHRPSLLMKCLTAKRPDAEVAFCLLRSLRLRKGPLDEKEIDSASSRKTVLHLAVERRWKRIVTLIMSKCQAIVTARDAQSRTPLEYAKHLRNLETAKKSLHIWDMIIETLQSAEHGNGTQLVRKSKKRGPSSRDSTPSKRPNLAQPCHDLKRGEGDESDAEESQCSLFTGEDGIQSSGSSNGIPEMIVL